MSRPVSRARAVHAPTARGSDAPPPPHVGLRDLQRGGPVHEDEDEDARSTTIDSTRPHAHSGERIPLQSRQMRWRVACFLAAAAFGTSPARCEAVCWASCQPYLLAAGFCLLCARAHVRMRTAAPCACRGSSSAVGGRLPVHTRRDRVVGRAAVTALYTLAVCSKAASCPAP